MNKMEKLSDDTVVRILTFLPSSEVARAIQTSKRFRGFGDSRFLWQSLCNVASVPSLQSSILANASKFNPEDSHITTLRSAARQLESLSKLDKVRWKKLHYPDTDPDTADGRIEKMEGHTMNVLLDRFALIVGGWGASDSNDVSIIDGGCLSAAATEDEAVKPVVNLVRTRNINVPSFRYGFSTAVHKGRLVVFGGCANGGYSGDVNNLYFVDLSFRVAPSASASVPSASAGPDPETPAPETLHMNCVTTQDNMPTPAPAWDAHWARIRSAPVGAVLAARATHSNNLTPPLPPAGALKPWTRGYHSASTITLDGRDCMIVWGGLHGRKPTARMEILDLDTLAWRRGDYRGTEPAPRFGHSCITMSDEDSGGDSGAGGGVSVDRLVFTGGSDGNDLMRSGQELREIHVLHVVRSAVAGKGPASQDVLVWSTPRLDVLPRSMTLDAAIPGRCHCACQAGNKILFYSGGAQHRNTISTLHVPPSGSLFDSTDDRGDRADGVVEALCAGSLDLQGQADYRAEAESDAAEAEGSTSSSTYTQSTYKGPSSYVLQLPLVASSKKGSALPLTADRSTGIPVRRCSGSAGRVGRHLLLFGGFSSSHRELGDVWALDMAYGASDERTADRVAFQSSEGEGDDEEEEEEAPVRRGGGNLLQQLNMMMQLSQMVGRKRTAPQCFLVD
ncbi:hypothetical protein B484DRAFT_455238 [Ochromonadaceae sp. CCMP2298]|nr:hypothetical protein B484DRAFT_455238 [Ochromonadaceae sp. CCMP2298]